MSPRVDALSCYQQVVVENARRFLAAADQGSAEVARLLGCQSEPGIVYPVAFGAAMAEMRQLIALIDAQEARR